MKREIKNKIREDNGFTHSDAELRAIHKFTKANYRYINVGFNKRTREDEIKMIEFLDSLDGSKSEYIKNLIRENMKKNGLL